MEGYSKFQLSKFLDSRRDYQMVIRTDSAEEMLKAMQDIKPFLDGIEKRVATEPVSQSTLFQPDTLQQQQLNQPCKKCGGEQIFNPKTGKVFCKAKCWLK